GRLELPLDELDPKHPLEVLPGPADRHGHLPGPSDGEPELAQLGDGDRHVLGVGGVAADGGPGEPGRGLGEAEPVRGTLEGDRDPQDVRWLCGLFFRSGHARTVLPMGSWGRGIALPDKANRHAKSCQQFARRARPDAMKSDYRRADFPIRVAGGTTVTDSTYCRNASGTGRSAASYPAGVPASAAPRGRSGTAAAAVPNNFRNCSGLTRKLRLARPVPVDSRPSSAARRCTSATLSAFR